MIKSIFYRVIDFITRRPKELYWMESPDGYEIEYWVMTQYQIPGDKRRGFVSIKRNIFGIWHVPENHDFFLTDGKYSPMRKVKRK